MRLTPEQLVFITERRVATLTTLRPDGSPHVVPVAFTWDAPRELIRISAEADSVKVRNIVQGPRIRSGTRPAPPGPGRAALCQVDGGRWLTFEGNMTVTADAQEIAAARAAHLRRYGLQFALPDAAAHVVLLLTPIRILGSDYMVP